MTSLEKARAFFEGKGKKLALAVAPLAMVAASAVPAQASLFFGPTSAFITDGGDNASSGKGD